MFHWGFGYGGVILSWVSLLRSHCHTEYLTLRQITMFYGLGAIRAAAVLFALLAIWIFFVVVLFVFLFFLRWKNNDPH